jgi:hypothetical protein
MFHDCSIGCSMTAVPDRQENLSAYKIKSTKNYTKLAAHTAPQKKVQYILKHCKNIFGNNEKHFLNAKKNH